MYEYVQTAKGWVLYWGGANLHQTKKQEAPAPKKTEVPKTAEHRPPVAAARAA